MLIASGYQKGICRRVRLLETLDFRLPEEFWIKIDSSLAAITRKGSIALAAVCDPKDMIR